MNIYYHGTPTSNIKVLKPMLSNHKKKYVYLTISEVVATFYMVKNNFYTYGFEKGTNIPEYTEYYPDALKDTYKNKKGYLYKCITEKAMHNPTNIWCAIVTEEEVTTDSFVTVEDVYKKLLEYESNGELKIKRYSELTTKEIEFINRQIKGVIESDNLLVKDNDDSKFIKSKFPKLWAEVEETVANM